MTARSFLCAVLDPMSALSDTQTPPPAGSATGNSPQATSAEQGFKPTTFKTYYSGHFSFAMHAGVEICPGFSACAYRQLRRGDPKLWSSDGLGRFAEWVPDGIRPEKRPSLPESEPAQGGRVEGWATTLPNCRNTRRSWPGILRRGCLGTTGRPWSKPVQVSIPHKPPLK